MKSMTFLWKLSGSGLKSWFFSNASIRYRVFTGVWGIRCCFSSSNVFSMRLATFFVVSCGQVTSNIVLYLCVFMEYSRHISGLSRQTHSIVYLSLLNAELSGSVLDLLKFRKH